MMNGFFCVAAGGAIGASCRHLLGIITLKAFGSDFPYGTFSANILGGFFMGLFVGVLAAKVSATESLRLFLGVGLLGGFTTFSAFSLDAVLMYQRKAYGALLTYISGSVILSIVALLLGLIIARKAFGS